MDNSHSTSTKIEELLQNHYQAPAPDPAFLSRIRSDLLAAKPGLIRPRSWLARNSGMRSWRYALAGVLLLILGAVFVIGPGQVWAQLESWIAYLPGFGKVELSGTRVLVEPVSYTESGVTFEVQEFVASPDETYLTINITGFTESELHTLQPGMPGFTDTVYIQWDGPDGQRRRLSSDLIIVHTNFHPCPTKDCQDKPSDGFHIEVIFKPLPLEINQVKIEWKPYRMVPCTDTTESWYLNIPLKPISEGNAQVFFQPGYSLQTAEVTRHGITISVNDVFSDESMTVIDAVVIAPEPDGHPSSSGVFLSADSGYKSGEKYFSNDVDLYPLIIPIQSISPSESGDPRVIWPARWQFDPVDPLATEMTLEIGKINFRYETRDWFEMEIGEDPEIGTTIPLDINIEIEGYLLHIYEARIVMAPAVVDGMVRDVKSIIFLDDKTISTDGKRITQLYFGPNVNWVLPVSSNGEGGFNPGFMLDPDIIKDGKIRVDIEMVEIEQVGPWVISWDVP